MTDTDEPSRPIGDGEPTPRERAIRLRRHHVLCSIGFEGKGYSDAFTANMAGIVEGRLRAETGGDEVIEIVADADVICAPCPLRVDSGCESADKINALDRRHGAALGLAPGNVLTWAEATRKARENVAPDDLDHLCKGCQWLPMGACKSALAVLRDNPESP